MDEQRNGNQAPKQDGATSVMTFRLQVPNALVGSIIGKQGEAVKAIREQSQAKVTIADSQPGEDRDVTLKGSLKSLEQAINLIIANVSQGRSHSFAPDQQIDESFSIKVLVANDQAGAIIGKGGEAIKQLREESGARISIGKKVDFIRVVTVTGNATTTRAALAALLRLVHDHPSSTRNPFAHGFRAPPAYPMNPPYAAFQTNPYNIHQTAFLETQTPLRCETLSLPNRSVGAIIGKGGQTINNMRMMSGCRIDVANQTEDSQFRTITLTGSKHSVDVARLLIQQANTQMTL